MRWRVPLLMLFACFARSFAGDSNNVKKAEYYLPYVSAPEYIISVSTVTNLSYREQYQMMYATVREFAISHHMQTCPTNMPVIYSGPPWCDFKDDHVVIEVTGKIKIAPYDEKFPIEDFRKIAGALIVTLRGAFPERVSIEERKYLSK